MEEVGFPSDGGIGRIGVGGRMRVDAEGAVGRGEEEGRGVGGGGLDLGRGGWKELEGVVGVVHHFLSPSSSDFSRVRVAVGGDHLIIRSGVEK